jgi:ribosomal protein S20
MRLNPNKEVFIVPNIKSAKKRVLVSASKTARNKAVKSNLKTTIKKAEASIAEGGDSREAIRLAIKRIDQAQAKGILHKNTAARRKSKLVRKLNNANA